MDVVPVHNKCVGQLARQEVEGGTSWEVERNSGKKEVGAFAGRHDERQLLLWA